MLYEGIPVKKKNQGETPAHPAPVHEQVFGREETIKDLDKGLAREEQESLSVPAPLHDSFWGIENRKKVFRQVREKAHGEQLAGMQDFENRQDFEAYTHFLSETEKKLGELGEKFHLDPSLLEDADTHILEFARLHPREADKNPEAVIAEALRATCAKEAEERRISLGYSWKSTKSLIERRGRKGELTFQMFKRSLEDFAEDYQEGYLSLATYISGDNAIRDTTGERVVELLKDEEALKAEFDSLNNKDNGSTTQNAA